MNIPRPCMSNLWFALSMLAMWLRLPGLHVRLAVRQFKSLGYRDSAIALLLKRCAR